METTCGVTDVWCGVVLQVFTLAGKLLRAFGNFGQGPAEFRHP